jgi:hypothetical protein
MPKSRDQRKRTDGADATQTIMREQNVIFMTARSRFFTLKMTGNTLTQALASTSNRVDE